MSEAISLRGVYAITDAALLPADVLYSRVEEALQAGLCLLQYRNKKDDWDARLKEAKALVELCQRYSTPLLINDDLDLCQAAGADGVHLGQGDSTLTLARETLGADAIIGITCHDKIALAEQAQRNGASYVAFGRFFASKTKPEAPPADISILQEASSKLNIPIVAIGGINAENGASLLQAGADALAVINYVFGHNDTNTRVQQLNSLFKP
ncbi:MAG: thiamine phosphate synthase [Pseudohongiellaceae bacterium]|nr:thiamine phosphate synthase [Pseudohongiellaceae bacterium]